MSHTLALKWWHFLHVLLPTALRAGAQGKISLFQTLFIHELQSVPTFWHLKVDIEDPKVQSDVSHALLTFTKV